jgi:predicted alpha/beta-fold hydrolase
VAPCFELAACADALSKPRNFIYNRHFVTRLRRRMRHKAQLFPEIYLTNGSIQGLGQIRTVRDFDQAITARFCGFAGADDYYARSSAMSVLAAIRTPTLVLTAQDDPFVPYSTFRSAALRENPSIRVVAPRYGGHCGFISRESGSERFWSEARILEFCVEHSKL